MMKMRWEGSEIGVVVVVGVGGGIVIGGGS